MLDADAIATAHELFRLASELGMPSGLDAEQQDNFSAVKAMVAAARVD